MENGERRNYPDFVPLDQIALIFSLGVLTGVAVMMDLMVLVRTGIL